MMLASFVDLRGVLRKKSLYFRQISDKISLHFVLYKVFPPLNNPLFSSEDGQRIGLVPINYVKIMNRNTASPPALPNNPLDNLTSSKNMFENAFKPN